MMKSCFIVLFLVVVAYGAINTHVDKDMLRTNKVPKLSDRTSEEPVEKIDLCPECELTIQGILDILKNPNDVVLMKKYLTDMCPYFTWIINKTECENLIKDSFETLLHQLIPALQNKRQVCKYLHMCDSEEKPTLYDRILLNIASTHLKAVKSGTGFKNAVCDECQFVINELHSVLGDKELQNKIKSYMEQACSYLQTFKDECKALVDQYFTIIVQKIEQYLGNAKECCQEIGLCAETPKAIPMTKIVSKEEAERQISRKRSSLRTFRHVQMDAVIFPRLQTRDGTTSGCIVCVTVFREIIDKLEESNATQWQLIDDIKAAVDEVLPKDVAKQVDSFLDTYGKQALTMLLEHLSAMKMCEDLHLCSKYETEFISRQNATAFKSMQCETCDAALQFAKSELQNPDTQAEIVQLFQMLCRYMPQSDQQECKNEMKIFIPQALQVLGQDMDPKGMCSAIHLC